jgi:hypothetical protein
MRRWCQLSTIFHNQQSTIQSKIQTEYPNHHCISEDTLETYQTKMKIHNILISSFLFERAVEAFQPITSTRARGIRRHASKDIITSIQQTSEDDNSVSEKGKQRSDVMAFLRKKGAVGKNKDFSTAMGVDEGPVGKNRSQGASGGTLFFCLQ